MGCTAATIRKIEADERKPSWQLAGLLATALGVPDEARALFLRVARQLQTVDHLAPANQSPVHNNPAATLSHAAYPRPVHNLPAPMTSLVDRVRDTANVIQVLTRTDVRLVTVLGSPGIGKTRLAIHAAKQVIEHFRDGVCFVDLAPLTDAALVLPTIAHSLAVAELGPTPLLDRLRTLLAEKELLLVLDNCEQVSAAAIEIAALLRGGKGLKVLATSRAPLWLGGEHEYALPPLSLPPRDLLLDPSDADKWPERLMTYEAVELFVTRVRQHQYDFSVTPANAAQICTICLRLDGIPLALELAAAALHRMTLAHLATLFQDEANWLHELHSPARDLPPRQRTLTLAIAWSYSLLDVKTQTSFRQLGVFVGGFTAAAAQTVCGSDPATLARLTEHNLLARAPERWQLLEMIREFALAQMSSAERTATQQSHSTYFVAQAVTNFDVVARDHANFRAALVWAIASQDAYAALTLCIKQCWFWETHGYLREGMTLARAALAIPAAVDPNLRIDVLQRVSTLAWQGHQFAIAMQFAEEAATLARRNDLPAKLASTLIVLGRIWIEQGDYSHAEIALQESIQLARQAPHLFNPGCPLTQLSEVALARGDWAAAQAHLAQAIPCLVSTHESLLVDVHVAMAHTHLAEVALAYGHPNQARHELRQALPQARLHIRRLRCLLVTLVGILLRPLPTTQTQDVTAAASLLGTVAGLGERSGDPLSPLFQALLAQRAERVKQRLPQSEWQAAWQVGHTWTQAQAVAEAERWLALDFER